MVLGFPRTSKSIVDKGPAGPLVKVSTGTEMRLASSMCITPQRYMLEAPYGQKILFPATLTPP